MYRLSLDSAIQHWNGMQSTGWHLRNDHLVNPVGAEWGYIKARFCKYLQTSPCRQFLPTTVQEAQEQKVSRGKGRRRALSSRRFIYHTVQFACKAGRRRALKEQSYFKKTIASSLNFLPDITTSHTKLSKVNQLSFALRAKTCSVRRSEFLAIWQREVKFPLQGRVPTHDSIS